MEVLIMSIQSHSKPSDSVIIFSVQRKELSNRVNALIHDDLLTQLDKHKIEYKELVGCFGGDHEILY
jgi:hypothetical protein